MKYYRVISTSVLFLLLGTTLPAFAQKGDEEKGGEKAPQAEQKAQPQHAQKAAPQRAEKPQPQRAEKAQPQRAEKAQPQRTEKVPPQRAEKAQPQHAQKVTPQRAEKAQPQRAQTQQPAKQREQTVASNNGGGGQYGRISNANYSAHFGEGHSFHMGHPEMMGGYNRFQYGGYSFGYNEAWPVGWDYNDQCYVIFLDGGYYLYDVRHPGFRLTLNIF